MSPKTDSNVIEKRRSKRRPVLDTFSLFVVVPKKGIHRLQVHDVSDFGIGFDIDTDGEVAADYPLKNGDRIELHFYLNQSLYLPLTVDIVRLEQVKTVRRVGAELNKKESAALKAYLSFLKMLDEIVDVAQVTQG